MINDKSDYLVFVDCETTGFDWFRNDIICWSAIVLNKDLDEISRKNVKAKPNFRFWSEESENIHKISQIEAMGHQSQKSACREIIDYLLSFESENNEPLSWFDHSQNQFDWKMTLGMFLKTNMHYELFKRLRGDYLNSTIKIAKQKGFKKNNKLNQWAERINFKLDHHNSMSDAECSVELYKHLLGRQQDVAFGV